ncbi:MAG: carboxylating nicotinate-nucleotide diphosphorylase, partial [Verrucomicrobiales bacterium]|nr:carboxylating nicotinate-nucleotide diphosphorylase [Verrucomicrobiales bacterium]
CFGFAGGRVPGILRPDMELLDPEHVRRLVRAALAEDIGAGDVTSEAVVPDSAIATGVMRAREPLVVAGLDVAAAVFNEVSDRVEVIRLVRDGQRVQTGASLLRVRGPARALLGAERVALNFVQRMSGIATLTAQFVDAVQGTGAKITDTRKTTPGLRALEKYAVRCGGGHNHRLGLFDMVLIKDNHLAVLKDAEPFPIAAADARARAKHPSLEVEVECETLEQVEQALEAGADIILLDNMNVLQLRLAVQRARGKARTEASGGITLANVRAVAETGVDFISIGALTHSARAVDVALDLEP